MKSFLVTVTPPTPNGDLHVGHLSGPFLAADVFTRFQRMLGNDSLFTTGTDDHQSYVLTAALRQKRDPTELAASFADQIQATLEAAEIRVDLFTRSLGNRSHIAYVQRLFKELFDQRLIVPKRHRALHCNGCNHFLFEGFVRGRCPYCGEETPGHLCEMCGRVNDPINLIEPICSCCLGRPSTVERDGLFFPLESHREALESYWASRMTWRPHLKMLCESMLATELPEYPVSYPGRWGVPVPIDGFDQQVVNVWLEMYAGHLDAICRSKRVANPGMPNDAETLVQFLGHDNSFYNAVLHPAISLTLGRRWPVPQYLVTNEFYFLEGKKFSTSRNHTVLGRDALALVRADSLRYHLARTNPERWQTDFSSNALIYTDQHELKGTWISAIESLFRLAQGGSAAEHAGESDLLVRSLIQGTAADLERFYGVESFSLRRASGALLEFVTACGEYAVRALQTPSSPASSARSPDAASLLKALALLTAPLMPSLGQEIWKRLGLSGHVSEQRWVTA
jgi:methionyl-tRNA synthetase